MLAGSKLKAFRELIAGATRDELIWINGYVSALIGDAGTATTAAAPSANAAGASVLAGCTVVYGTESGNSKKVANELSAKIKKQGLPVKTKNLEQYKNTDLAKENCLLVVMSTQGDGEPPAGAKKFYDYLLGSNDIRLDKLKYSVLALGDTSYPLFCKAGEDVDERLAALGAERLVPMKKCDTDFEPEAQEWIDELLQSAVQSAPASQPAVVKAKPASSGKKIHNGKVVTSINLNDRESSKETYHIEIASEDEIVYEPGDSIGIIARNTDAAVNKILELLEVSEMQPFAFKNNTYTASELFRHKINIQYLPERIIQQYAKLLGKEIPSIRMDLADLLRIYPFDQSINVQQFIDILDPVAPRLYSISSSPASHGNNEVHITVSRSTFEVDSQKRFGLCSDYLSCKSVDDEMEFYVQKNSSFKLPDSDADVIMIGPGTGIAPFRSFLFERDAQGAQGRNWLFFGDQHFVSDFLYQTEMLSFFETGTLTRLNTAFSRDQKEKIYVQHRMMQQATELYNWIQSGAVIYICGAKHPMSTDVENTLLQIFQTKGGMNEEEASDYLTVLSDSGKYHKDVY